MKVPHVRRGRIIEVKNFQGIDTYKLDVGYSWSDSEGRWKLGDVVEIRPYIMGTVLATKVEERS
jgi:hypothetical protein